MSWNQQLGKKLNKQQLLKVVYRYGVLSRTALIEHTQLKKATVSNLVNELLDEQLLKEAGQDASTGGRRSQLLELNPHAGYALGIEMGVHYLHGVVITLRGEIIFEKQLAVNGLDYDVYVAEMRKLMSDLEQQVPASRYGIVGLGIAVPAAVDLTGRIIEAPNLHWHNKDLLGDLAPHVAYPIEIVNEANAGAYAEYHGKQQRTNDLLYVSVGTGIGVGILLDGQMYQGMSGFAGENGHTIIQFDGRPCTCGKVGCWEAYASTQALLQQARALPSQPQTLQEVLTLAENGDPHVLQLFDDIANMLAIGIANLLLSYNPSTVIIGNRMTAAQRFIEPTLQQAMSRYTTAYHLENCTIQFSKLTAHAIVIGTSTRMVERFLQQTD